MHTTKKSLQDDLKNLDDQLLSGNYAEDLEVGDILNMRKEVIEKTRKIVQLVDKKQQSLGVSERADLKKLLNNRFLQLRMNARALKHRIRARLQSRKFELSRLERAYCQASSNG